MNPTADIIYQFLLDQGLTISTDGDWQAFVSFFPDMPDNSVCIIDTAGRQDGRLMSTGEQVEHPGFQVQLRGLSYPDTLAKAQAIATAFDAVRKALVVVDGTTYTLENVSRAGCIIPLGIEEIEDRRRSLFTINAVVTITV